MIKLKILNDSKCSGPNPTPPQNTPHFLTDTRLFGLIMRATYQWFLATHFLHCDAQRRSRPGRIPPLGRFLPHNQPWSRPATASRSNLTAVPLPGTLSSTVGSPSLCRPLESLPS